MHIEKNIRSMVSLVLLGGMLFIAACAGAGGGSATTAQQDSTPYNAVNSLSFETYSQGTESGFLSDQYALDAPTLFVIRSQEELESFWTKHAAIFFPQPGLPTVDFEQEMFIAVVDTIEPTTGYTLTIESLEVGDASVNVHARKVVPESDAVVGDALTVPYHIIRLTTSDKEFVLDVATAD